MQTHAAKEESVSKLRKAIIVRLLLFAAFWLGGCTFLSSPIDVSGVWEGHIEWTHSGLQSPITLDLLHVKSDLSGTITGGPASMQYELTITKGRARTVTLSLEASGVLETTPQQNIALKLQGDFHQDRMAGTGTQTINGTTYELVWEAVLVTPAVPQE
jgi:hypothetical protein